jgi:MFS family permease
MLAGALFGGLCNTAPELMGARILLGVGTATARMFVYTISLQKSPLVQWSLKLHTHVFDIQQEDFWTPLILYVSSIQLMKIGSIFASWLTFAMVYYPDPTSSWAWRVPTLMQGFGPVLLACGVYFIPQSPRWLVKHQRIKEAHEILAKYQHDYQDTLMPVQTAQWMIP